MKYVLTIVLLIFSSVLASAQMVGPYVEGPAISTYPSAVRCFSHKDFSQFLRSRGLKMIVLAGSNQNEVKKLILFNGEDVVVANIIPDNRACILDIMEKPYFTEEFHFKKNPTETPQ